MKTKRGKKASAKSAQADAESNRIGDIELPAPINLATGVKLENVLAYLQLRFDQAEKDDGRENAADELFQAAFTASAFLGKLLESHSEILHARLQRSTPSSFPILLPRKDWPTWLNNIADLRSPNKKRADAAQGLTAHMEKDAAHLYKKWKGLQKQSSQGVDDDRHGFSTALISKILNEKGVNAAVAYLPPPSKKTFDIWWQLEDAKLKNQYESRDIGYWYVHPDILEESKKKATDPLPSSDSDHARRTVLPNFKSAFIQALRRLHIQKYTSD